MRQVTVFREAGRFAGWPANYGMWAWGDELVAVFTVGTMDTTVAGHARDRAQPFVTVQARSLDGGETWDCAAMPCRTPGGRALSADEHQVPELQAGAAISAGLDNTPAQCPGDIDFTHPDFAMMCARTGLGAGTASWFYVSYDRCHTWAGPYALPMFGEAGIEARTDYLVTDRESCTLFVSAARADGGEGKGVLCVRTQDGGRSFQPLSWVTTCDEGYAIMPASARLPDGRIVTAVRRAGPRAGEDAYWIDLHVSDDGGLSWEYVSTPVSCTGRGGNPPAMALLPDGRLCLVSGYRDPPFEMQARLSEDGGATWSDPRTLRSGGGNSDMGYPRLVQRADGCLVAAYYFNDAPKGKRYIGATIWRA